jgi:hypothetical protein
MTPTGFEQPLDSSNETAIRVSGGAKFDALPDGDASPQAGAENGEPAQSADGLARALALVERLDLTDEERAEVVRRLLRS